MFKKIFFTLLTYISIVNFAFADTSKDAIREWIYPDSTILNESITAEKNWVIFWLLSYVKDTVFGLLMVIAIWVFLYLWFKLVIARGNPEEFKKAITMFVYALVWIVLVSLAWAIVYIVAWVQF